MLKKIIITESQYERLKASINENEVYSKMVARIKDDLTRNYEPVLGVKRKGGEYIEIPMFKIKVDGEMITPKALYDYILYKYKMGEDFIKQVITDWAFGKIGEDNRLSKNVSLNESQG